VGLITSLHQTYLRHTSNARDRRIMHTVIFGVIVAPSLLLALNAYDRVYDDTTALALDRRRTVAQLGALAARERLDHLTTLARSLASRSATKNSSKSFELSASTG